MTALRAVARGGGRLLVSPPQWETRRVRKGLSPGDLGDLLELPLLAVLATYRRDGTVLLSPVWHEWRDNGFNVVTQSRDGKAGTDRLASL